MVDANKSLLSSLGQKKTFLFNLSKAELTRFTICELDEDPFQFEGIDPDNLCLSANDLAPSFSGSFIPEADSFLQHS